VGDVASADVKSTQDFLVEDESVTLKKRIEAEMAVPSVYDYDPSILQKAMGKMRNSFSLMRGYGEPDEVKGREEERKKEFEELLGITFAPKEFQSLARRGFVQPIEDILLGFVQPLTNKGIVGDRNPGISWPRKRGRGSLYEISKLKPRG
jgi:membrane-associated HD superfamily phosphohydrolase